MTNNEIQVTDPSLNNSNNQILTAETTFKEPKKSANQKKKKNS